MKINQIINAIEAIAPLEAAASWDLSGLQVASQRTDAHIFAVCLDPSPVSIAAALAANAQCILSHHPLLLKPTLPNKKNAYYEALRLLFQADVPLYTAHTSLDVNPKGPAGWLAQELDLRATSVLEPVTATKHPGQLGYGLVGDLPKPQTFAQIMAQIGNNVSLSTATVCGEIPQTIQRLAYCTGSGSSLLETAAQAGAQLFVTGDVKYHTAVETPICVCDVGHHSLEEEMMHRMQLLLQKKLPDIMVVFIPSVSPFCPVALP